MKLRLSELSLLALPFISACATLKDTHCGTTNWSPIGQTDATHFRPEEFVLNHEKVCGAERVNVPEYHAGFELGMSRMCTAKDQFLFGYFNKSPNAQCKPDPTLKKAYDDGVTYQKNAASLASLSQTKDEQVSREAADDESHRHDNVGKILARGLVGDSSHASENTQASIDQIRADQKEIERTYEGAFIRAQWVKANARDYTY
jgi:hypothetical protein